MCVSFSHQLETLTCIYYSIQFYLCDSHMKPVTALLQAENLFFISDVFVYLCFPLADTLKFLLEFHQCVLYSFFHILCRFCELFFFMIYSFPLHSKCVYPTLLILVCCHVLTARDLLPQDDISVVNVIIFIGVCLWLTLVRGQHVSHLNNF
jgi:hypothetical protein